MSGACTSIFEIVAFSLVEKPITLTPSLLLHKISIDIHGAVKDAENIDVAIGFY